VVGVILAIAPGWNIPLLSLLLLAQCCLLLLLLPPGIHPQPHMPPHLVQLQPARRVFVLKCVQHRGVKDLLHECLAYCWGKAAGQQVSHLWWGQQLVVQRGQ
jgi:hypothetical protein